MLVKAKYATCEHLTEEAIKNFFCSIRTNLYLTKESTYTVYALSMFKGNLFLQIINDLDEPCWIPASFFEIINNKVQSDWVCNLFDKEPKMILGPSFIAKDIRSYNAMVEQEPKETKLFWGMVEKIKD